MREDSANDFAHTLSRAITEKGYSLTTLVDMLGERGMKSTPATLSYWQAGKSLPRRRASMAVLPELEEILELAPGALSEALALTISQRPARRPDLASNVNSAARPNLDMIPRNRAVSSLIDENLDLSDEAERVALMDFVTVAEDFRSWRNETVLLARATRRHGSTVHLGFLTGDGRSASLDDLAGFEFRGAQVEKALPFGDSAIAVVLRLPPSPAANMLQQVSFVTRRRSDGPLAETDERIFPWIMRHYVCDLIFAGKVPQSIEFLRATAERDGNSSVRTYRTQPVPICGSAAQITLDDVSLGSCKLRWEVPA